MGFSPRLCVSAGDSCRYCVVDFLFHCGVGGPRSEECEWGEFPAETLRRREFGFVLRFLRVSASLREMAVVIASWSFCFTAVWGAVIGVE